MPPDQRFVEHLRSLGTEERAFMQRKGRKRFNDSVSEAIRLEVSDGYCHGACLHWLQVSLGSDSKALEISHRDASLVSRMAVTQFKWDQLFRQQEQQKQILEEFKANKVAQWFEAGAREKLLALGRWLENLKCDYSFSIVLPPEKSTIEWCPREGVRLDPHSRLEIQRRIDEVLGSLPSEAERFVIDKAKSALPRKLERLSDAPLGMYTKKIWQFVEPRLKGASGERYFETMLPVVACDGHHSGRISEFLCGALATPSLTEGRGVLFTFMCGVRDAPATIEEPKGHALAILKVSDQSYLLFDPNLGVYRFREVPQLLAALILLLVDCYGKRSLAQEDDWLLFAKSGQPVPAAFAGDGNLLSRMLLNRDTAVKDLRDYLVEQTKEAYQIASQFLSARASVLGYGARSKDLLVRYDSAGDSRRLSELEAFQREWDEASRLEAELRKEAERRCEGIRSFLTTDSNGSGKRLDDDGLKRFVKEEGDISATGLRELHTYLSGSI